MNTNELWDRYQSLRFSDLPNEVAQVAQHSILDWYGCALAGSKEPLSDILQAQYEHRQGECAVIGTKLKLESSTAALLNGAAGHALDFDDTNIAVGCHATAPVLPAALAVAEEIGASGQQLLTALVVGVEVQGRIHRAMGTDHYTRGWHTTATYGAFGATAAVAHLLGFDSDEFGTAMGLAASHASGVKSNFGTMTKPFHAGHAAESGVNCSNLVRKGFTANSDAVFGNQGFITAASNGKTTTSNSDDDNQWLISQTLFKYHAACHLTHASMESLGRIKEQIDRNRVSSVVLTVHPSILNVCGIPEPKTGLEGKFSLRGTASLTLSDFDTANPATFVDETISSDLVQAGIKYVVVETDASLTTMQTRVTVTDQDQIVREEFHDTGVPEQDLDAQEKKLIRKFNGLCNFVGLDPELHQKIAEGFYSDAAVQH